MDGQMPAILILTEAKFPRELLASGVPTVVERLLNVLVGRVSTALKHPSGLREVRAFSSL
jgi:hypothetical protein